MFGGLVSPFYGELRLSRHIVYNTSHESRLGGGAFGTVYRGTLKAHKGGKWPETPVAVKILTNPPTDPKEQALFVREIESIACLRHKTLINYVTCAIGEQYILVTEFAGQSLENLINQPHQPGLEFNSTAKTIALIGTACGIAEIHSKNLLHRDLKPDNILMDEHMYPRICDFGLARFMPDPETIRAQAQMTGACGTCRYMAPEVANPPETDDGSPSYDQKVDVFSYAMIIYHVLTGQKPFVEKQTPWVIMTAYVDGHRPDVPDNMPEVWKDLMIRCWDQNPKERPAMAEVRDRMVANPEAFFVDKSVDAQKVRDYLRYIQ